MIMELALNKSSSCVDCCSDCTVLPCCSVAACCDVGCGIIAPDPVRYEYQEPEENFVSIDDVKIKGFLWKIGQQQQEKELEKRRILREEIEKRERERKEREEESRRVQEIIDLDQEEVQQPTGLVISAARSLASWNCSIKRISPDIQLIPRQEQRIVAEIELSDSELEQDQNSDGDEEEPLPLNAVSCVLKSQERENQEHVIILHSEEEAESPEQPKAVRKRNPPPRKSAKRRPYVNRRGRHMYECHACGKKVQSNYNLRRHMMIHTGERPFPCDLCERRFREFSDLKKHRRRHSHDPRFICMICHLGQPLEQDSTRCADCDSKNLMIKPQPEGVVLDKAEGDQEMEEDEDEMDEEEEEEELQEEEEEEEEQPQLRAPPALMVTLVPPQETGSSSANQPSRPPLPRSCSSANSSSSVSNDGNVSAQNTRNRSRRSYPCPLCHRPFGTRHNLKRHYMIHTGEKPFSCSKCRKPFRECSTLKKHMVTHVRDRWYKCLRCPSKFRDYLEYSDHKASHLEELRSRKSSSTYESDEDGGSSVEDGLECCECQQRFTELDAYTAHLKQHDLELYGMSVDDLDEEQDEVDVA